MPSLHSSQPDGIIGQKCCLKCNGVEFIDELKNKVHQLHYQIQSNALLTDLQGGGSGVGGSSDSVSFPDISAPLHLGSCQLRGSKSISSEQANAASSCTHSLTPSFQLVRAEPLGNFHFRRHSLDLGGGFGFFNLNLCLCVWGGG